MEISEILKRVDHTCLSTDAVWSDIKKLIDEGREFSAASVCIPPCYVKRACEYAGGSIKICTVIGFPNGYMTSRAKLCEAEDAVKNGADELDMVINVGLLKDREYEKTADEIKSIKQVCGDKVLKVIIEACLLTDEEKVKMCEIICKSGADYIKTSTGFSKGGATFEDVALFARHITPPVKIKAAGGISSFEDARKFIQLGADRLGTSRLIRLAKEIKSQKEG